MSQSWSIIVFCYDEKDTVAEVIDSSIEVGNQISGGDFEVIVVDDGSKDGSSEIIRKKADINSSVKVFCHDENLGIGSALRTGYKQAGKENIVAVPADAQFDLKELLPVAVIESDTFISFYREENLQYSPFRNALSFYNKKLIEWYCGNSLKDVNWIKVYKNEQLQKVDMQLKSSLIESEISSKLIKLGYNFEEIQSNYLPRRGGKNKGASFRIVWQAFVEMRKLIRTVRRFKPEVSGK